MPQKDGQPRTHLAAYRSLHRVTATPAGLLGALSTKVFVSPDVILLPRVPARSCTSLAIVNASCFSAYRR
jgi:hypothetical protein